MVAVATRCSVPPLEVIQALNAIAQVTSLSLAAHAASKSVHCTSIVVKTKSVPPVPWGG